MLSSLAKVKKSYYDFSKLKKINQLIIEHNNKFVKKHLNDEIFDNIRGNSLDSQQREAILRDEVSNLTIAGAGSGKTLIICGKVKYLLEKKNIDPKDILLLSYSKKSADDLYRKLKEIDSKLTVATFHKLGLDILKETNNKVFDVEEQYNAIIESYFRDELKNKENMIKKVFYFFSYFSSYQKNLKKYSNLGDMFGDLKKSDLETLNFLKNLSLNTDKKETIKKELVKSYQELQIANFYFINGINYEYEKPYEKDLSTNDKKQYTPDFYLKDYNIYHEHYGIDRDGKAKQYEGKIAKDYVNTITWKRSVHQTYNTICIETYSYEVEDGTIFKKLSEELRKHKVKFNPLSPEEIYNALFSYYGEKNFKSFINLVKTFLNLYKSRYKTDEQFKKFEDYEFANFYEKQRTLLFLEIVKDVYSYYMERVRTNNRIDFDDMILKSSDQLSLTNKFSYKYIIVKIISQLQIFFNSLYSCFM